MFRLQVYLTIQLVMTLTMAADFDEEAIRQEIRRKIGMVVDDYHNRRFEKIASSNFLPESTIMSPGNPGVKYTEIAKRYEGAFASGSVRFEMKIDGMLVTPTQVAEKHRYWLSNAEGQETSHGEALAVWQKRNDDWFIMYTMVWGDVSAPLEEKGN